MDLNTLVAASLWMILPLIGLGSLLHFLYEWTDRGRFSAIFSAVNESYWEHIKIAIWPVTLLAILLFAFGGHRYASFVPAATVALYSIPISMVGIVFLYKSITKRNVLWLDIGVFAVTIGLAQIIFVGFLKQLQPSPLTVAIASVYLAGLIVAFLRFTLRPPKEPDVFIDPITHEYGRAGHGYDERGDFGGHEQSREG